MNLRKVSASDSKPLADLIRSVFEEYDAPKQGTVYSDPTTDKLYDLFSKEKSVLWVAELDGEVLGSCGVYPSEGLPIGCVELVKFYLQPKARGKRIGRKLLESSIQSALDFGYTGMYIESLPHFEAAVALYYKLGFKKLSEPMCISVHTTCDIWMYKDI